MLALKEIEAFLNGNRHSLLNCGRDRLGLGRKFSDNVIQKWLDITSEGGF